VTSDALINKIVADLLDLILPFILRCVALQESQSSRVAESLAD